MHKNNYVPTIIERSARRATRFVSSGGATLKYWKMAAHRAYRRKMNMQVHNITVGNINPDEYDDTANKRCRCTCRDIW